MIRFSCSACGNPVSAPDDCAGRGTICPRCRKPLTVPAALPPAAPITGQKPPLSGKGAKASPKPPQRPSALQARTQPGQPRTAPQTKPRRSIVARLAMLGSVLVVVFLAGGVAGYSLALRLETDRHAPLLDETKREIAKLTSDLQTGKEAATARKESTETLPRNESRQPTKVPEPSDAPAKATPKSASTEEAPIKEKPKTSSLPEVRKELPKPSTKEQPAKEQRPPKEEPKEPVRVELPKPPTLDPALEGPAEPPVPEEVVFKRRKETTDEDLRKQLMAVPDVGLTQPATATLYEPLLEAQKTGRRARASASPAALPPDYGLQFLAQLAKTQKRPDLLYFPWRLGVDCQLGKEAAERLHVLSINLRTCLQASTPEKDIRPDPDKLRELLLKGSLPGRRGIKGANAVQIKPSEWRQPGAIPALMQMLQPENTPIRLLLVEMLAQIEGKEASVALAQRALFDLSPQVREKAVRALAERPKNEYRQVLTAGFLYPWPPVADHAAEALVAIKDKEMVPTLIDLLNQPNPMLPFPVKDKAKEVLAVRELVCVNHLCNCMVCHAPSLAREDLIRGRVPVPGEDPPRLYYAETTGLFVRAGTTFLRQDFSVVQPIPVPGKWTANQRMDYMVRTRPLSKQEQLRFQKMQKENPKPVAHEQREALLFTLKELTGKDAGSRQEDWKALLRGTARKDEPGKDG